MPLTVLLWKRSSIDLYSVYCFTCLQWKKWHQCHFLDPHADAYLTKTVKFGQISKISVVLECLQQLQQNFSEVQPLYKFCNVILSKNLRGCSLSLKGWRWRLRGGSGAGGG